MERLWCGAGKSKEKHDTDVSDGEVAVWTVDDHQLANSSTHTGMMNLSLVYLDQLICHT